MTPRRIGPVFAVAALAMTVAAPVAAQDGLQVRSDSAYRVRPDAGEVDVVFKTKLANRAKPKGGSRTGYSGWGSIVVPVGAVDLEIRGKKVRSEQTSGDEETRGYMLEFPTIWFRDKVTVTTAFTLIDDGPAQGDPTSFRDGYFYVCWPGQGSEKGMVSADVPAGWDLYTDGAAATAVSGTERDQSYRLETKQSPYPGQRDRCTAGFLRETAELTEGGTSQSPVTFLAWAEQGPWLESTEAAVATVLPSLEALLGPLPPVAGDDTPLSIHESAAAVHPYASGDLSPADGRIRIGEAIDDPAAVALPLARTWLGPTSPVSSPWLREGLAAWISYHTLGRSCPPASAYPAAALEHYGDPDLDGHWFVPSTAAPQSAWDYWDWQHSTACGVVEDAADIVGPAAMAAIIAELVNGLDEATVDAWMAALSSHEPAAGPSVADVLATDFEAAGIDAPPPAIELISSDDGPVDFNDGFEEPDDDGTWSSIGT